MPTSRNVFLQILIIKRCGLCTVHKFRAQNPCIFNNELENVYFSHIKIYKKLQITFL